MRKKKTETADGAGAPEAKKAKKLVRTRIEVAAHQLRPAPWNPRPEITSESVADITASIREIGLIQPLVVMRDPDKPSFKGTDFYLIISGHRRYRACVDARAYPIPCDLVDVDVETAKQMTIIENLQRRDADPLMEADLIAGLIEGGMTQAEIAAETGRGARWVARRANLRKLSKSWRKRVSDGEEITIDCLEHVAAYPEDIQEKCKDARGGYYGGVDGILTWSGVKWQFERESRDLREVLFDTESCLTCARNTGCCPDLFDDDGGKGATLGKCLDAGCYAAKTNEAIESAVAKAEKKGRTVVTGKQPYQCGVYGTTKKPTKTNTALYVYTDCNGRKEMVYAAPPPKKDEDAEKAEKARRREEKKINRIIEEARNEAAEKFEKWMEEREKDGDWPMWLIDRAVESFLDSWGDYEIDMFAANTGFKASDEEADRIYREFLAKIHCTPRSAVDARQGVGGDADDAEPADDADDADGDADGDGLLAEAEM